MCMYRFPGSPQGIQSFGTGAVDGCELPSVGARNGTGPLQEQSTLLTTSLQPLVKAFLKTVSHFLNNTIW